MHAVAEVDRKWGEAAGEVADHEVTENQDRARRSGRAHDRAMAWTADARPICRR